MDLETLQALIRDISYLSREDHELLTSLKKSIEEADERYYEKLHEWLSDWLHCLEGPNEYRGRFKALISPGPISERAFEEVSVLVELGILD